MNWQEWFGFHNGGQCAQAALNDPDLGHSTASKTYQWFKGKVCGMRVSCCVCGAVEECYADGDPLERATAEQKQSFADWEGQLECSIPIAIEVGQTTFGTLISADCEGHHWDNFDFI